MGVGWSAMVRQGETQPDPRIGPVRKIWVWPISSKALRLHGNQWLLDFGVFFCFFFQVFCCFFKTPRKLLGKIDLNSRSFLVVVFFSSRCFGGNDPIWLRLSHIFSNIQKTEVIGGTWLKQQIFFSNAKKGTNFVFFPQDFLFLAGISGVSWSNHQLEWRAFTSGLLVRNNDTEVMDGFQIYSPWSDYHDGHLYETINWKLGVFGNFDIFVVYMFIPKLGGRWISFIRTLYFHLSWYLRVLMFFNVHPRCIPQNICRFCGWGCHLGDVFMSSNSNFSAIVKTRTCNSHMF